jgi:hypothetical protein
MRAIALSSTLVSLLAAGCERGWDYTNHLAVTEAPAGRYAVRLDGEHRIHGGFLGEPAAMLVDREHTEVAVAAGAGGVMVVSRSIGEDPADTPGVYATPASGPPRLVSAGLGMRPTVAPLGDDYVVAWADYPGIELARVSAAGELIEAVGAIAGLSGGGLPGLVAVPDGVVLAVRGPDANGYQTVFLTRLDGDGRPGPLVEVATETINVAVSGGEHGLVVAWTVMGDSIDHTVYAQRLDPELAPLGPELEIAQVTWDAPGVPPVAVAGDASRFAVVWGSGRPGEPTLHAQIVGAEVTPVRTLGPGYGPSLTARGPVLHAHWLSVDDEIVWGELDDAGASELHVEP